MLTQIVVPLCFESAEMQTTSMVDFGVRASADVTCPLLQCETFERLGLNTVTSKPGSITHQEAFCRGGELKVSLFCVVFLIQNATDHETEASHIIPTSCV